jgi:hypothetical protein
VCVGGGQVLVRKAYPNRRRRDKPRLWKLQRMAIGAGNTGTATAASEKKRDVARNGSVAGSVTFQ